MSEIVDIQLKAPEPAPRRPQIGLSLDAKARQWLADKGYDPTYGARPLKRVIQKWVQDPLAQCCSQANCPTARRSSSALRTAPDDQRQGGRRRGRRVYEPKSSSVVQFPKTLIYEVRGPPEFRPSADKCRWEGGWR